MKHEQGMKLNNYQENIFSKVNRLAQKNDAINLGQGFPTFRPNSELIKQIQYSLDSEMHQYTDMRGQAALRGIIAKSYLDRFDAIYDIENEITITNGATQAISCCIQAVIETGDEAIIIEPCYDAYRPLIEKSGGIAVAAKMQINEQNTWYIDWLEVEKRVSSKTKLIIINTPNNPTGSTLKQNDIKELEKLVLKYNLLLLADEVYEYLVYEPYQHISIASSKILASRAFVISSFGKTLSATGWKIGYCCAPKELMQMFWSVHQYQVFSVCSIPQKAIANYIDQHTDVFDQVNQKYSQLKNWVINELRVSRWKVLPCEATFFILLDYSDLSNLTDMAYVEKMIVEYKLAFIPFSAFEKNSERKLVRMCFARSEETLKNVINNINIYNNSSR